MTKLEMVRQAVRELGEVPHAELSAFVRRQHATDIPPPIIAVILATLRDGELLERLRREAKKAIERAPASVA